MQNLPSSMPLSLLPAWALQDAKARFSEVVRGAQEQGPQRVTLRGQDAVVVLSATEYARLVPEPPGRTLYEAVMQGPFADVDGLDEILEEFRVRSPGRPPVDLAE